MGSHGRNIGMPLNKFTDDAWAGLEAGHENIFVGSSDEVIKFETMRQDIFTKFNESMRK